MESGPRKRLTISSLISTWDRPKPTTTITAPATPTTATAATPSRAVTMPGALERVFFGWGKPSTPASKDTFTGSLRHGKDTYWPTTLDRECDKAARILKSFCTDGFLAQEENGSQPTSPGFHDSTKFVTRKIPPRIIQNAMGLAIFSCVRSGLWMSGSGGSGILIARKADGTWSSPSGILLHTADLGFVLGIDIYDCVLVINNVAALEMFSRPRVALGSDIGLTVGPLMDIGAADNRKMQWKELNNTVLTYLKARGQHQSVKLDGSLVTERTNENERFYASNVNVLDILAGNMPRSIPETRPLFEVIKAAEGRTDFDAPLLDQLSQQPAPGDALIESSSPSPTELSPRTPFGVPNVDDPDPFGVIALEMAGLEIREAGSDHRPTSNQFEFNPAPTSPLFNVFAMNNGKRQSLDTYLSRSNRGSIMSTKTHATGMTDAFTQTDEAETPATAISPGRSDDGANEDVERSLSIAEPEEVDYTKIDFTVIQHLRSSLSLQEPDQLLPTTTPVAMQGTLEEVKEEAKEVEDSEPIVEKVQQTEADNEDNSDEINEDADADDEDEDDEEEPVVFEVAAAAEPARAAIMSSQVAQVIQAKGALVNIPKRVTPALPPRSPARLSRASKSEFGDDASIRSPLRQEFFPSDAESQSRASMEWNSQRRSRQSLNQTQPASYEQVAGRWSIDSTSQQMPTPQGTEGGSSADDSDHGPRTPKPEEELKADIEHSRRSEAEKTAHSVVFGHHHEEANTIAVA